MSFPGRTFAGRVKRFAERLAKRLLGPSVRSVQRLSDTDFLALLSIPGDGKDAPAVVGHYGQRVNENWPELPGSLTDLRVDLADLDDAELVARADRALEGDVHPSGLKAALRDDGGIDWGSNPSTSREWLLMLHRHAWWVLWAEAHRRTGDDKYARAFVTQMLDWVERHPLPAQKAEHFEPWRLMEAGLRMRVSWVPCFAAFYSASAFTDAAKLTMLRAIYDHGLFLNRFFTNRNHLVRESNGLLAVGLCFPEFAASGEWVENSLRRLDEELRTQVNADGSHIEMSVGYQWLTIDEFEVTRSLLDRFGRELPESDLHAALDRMYGFLKAVIRPDRSFPQLNDGFILWGADRLDEAGWRDDPGFRSRSFPNAGLHVMRSDWSPEARYLVADTGPYGGPHGHEDKLSFELFACGAPFIVDPGSYTYNKTDPFRDYFVGSQGHNTVLVDGGSQVRRWNDAYMSPAAEDVIHGKWFSDEQVDVAAGVYDEGYATYSNLGPPEDVTVDTDVCHERCFIFRKPDYWIVSDRLRGEGVHDFTFLFHLDPDVQVEELTDSGALLRSSRNGSQLVIRALTDVPMNTQVVRGEESPAQGWYSQDHYRKQPTSVLVFDVAGRSQLDVEWVLFPLPSSANAASVVADMSRDETAANNVVNVRFDAAHDTFKLPAAQNDRAPFEIELQGQKKLVDLD